MEIIKNNKGALYIDSKGVLRMVMEDFKKGIVRGIDVSNMNIDGVIITDELESIFSGHGNFNNKRHKVLWR
ncbi:MAG TPA: hypothetical protein VGC65_00375 [Bacteroidia bacterium]